ncbi:hypothetical protein HY404_02235 [Candidatus Microgenomates bacterium]|nr:hypothetical protein [Candidatus Microgenomates bacterium]
MPDESAQKPVSPASPTVGPATPPPVHEPITPNSEPSMPEATHDFPTIPTSEQTIPTMPPTDPTSPPFGSSSTSLTAGAQGLRPTAQPAPAAPNFSPGGIPPVITPPSPRRPKAKIVGAILALLILVVGIPVGVFLVQQNQEVREKASTCQDDCNSALTSCNNQCNQNFDSCTGTCGPADGSTEYESCYGACQGAQNSCNSGCGGEFDFCLTSCGSTTCPDGICSDEEFNNGSCAQDCGSPGSNVCGDGTCSDEEFNNNNCPQDCTPTDGDGDGGGGESNYCIEAGYHQCTPGSPAGTCTNNGQTCTSYEHYACNYGGQNYCDAPICDTNSCGGGDDGGGGGGCQYNNAYDAGLLADKPNPNDQCGTQDGIYCNNGNTNFCCYGDGNCFAGQQGSCTNNGNGSITTTQSAQIIEFSCPGQTSATGSCSENQTSKGNQPAGTYTTGGSGCGGFQIDAVGLCGSYKFVSCGGGGEPEVNNQCLNIKAYDTNWKQLSTSELAQLKVGDQIRVAVNGNTTSGTLNKARFRINNSSSWQETTAKNPNGEFYISVTISQGPPTWKFDAQLHHQESDTWF